MKKANQSKVYWCKCTNNPNLIREIERGSVPKDTGRVCDRCGGRIFEDKKRSGWIKEPRSVGNWRKVPRSE